MLKTTGLSDKLAFSRNNGNKLAFSKNNNSKPVFKKNNSNNKIDRFGVSRNNVEYTIKLGKLFKLGKLKSEKCLNFKIWLNQEKIC